MTQEAQETQEREEEREYGILPRKEKEGHGIESEDSDASAEWELV